MSLVVQAGIFSVGLAVGAIAAVSTSKSAPGRHPPASSNHQLQDITSAPPGAVVSTSTSVFGNIDAAASATQLKCGFPGKREDIYALLLGDFSPLIFLVLVEHPGLSFALYDWNQDLSRTFSGEVPT